MPYDAVELEEMCANVGKQRYGKNCENKTI